MLNQHSAFFIQKNARDGEKLTIRSGKRPRQQTERRTSDMTREDLKKIIEGMRAEQLVIHENTMQINDSIYEGQERIDNNKIDSVTYEEYKKELESSYQDKFIITKENYFIYQ